MIKASKLLTLEQRSFQWGLYTKLKNIYKFHYRFEDFLTHEIYFPTF
jgi:hypothetical protein